MKITTRDMKGWWKDPRRNIVRCYECDAEVHPKRHTLGDNVCLECGEIITQKQPNLLVRTNKK